MRLEVCQRRPPRASSSTIARSLRIQSTAKPKSNVPWPAPYVTALVVSLIAYLATAPLSPGTALLPSTSQPAAADLASRVLT